MNKCSINLNDKTILITGGLGFIGANLSEAILTQYPSSRIVIVDNYCDTYFNTRRAYKLINTFNIDRLSISTLSINSDNIEMLFKTTKPDIVIHLAFDERHENSVNTNIDGFYNILELCHKYNVEHTIYTSSDSVYGYQKCMPLSIYDTITNPLSLIAATKACEEILAASYSNSYGMSITGVRLFSVYGPFDRSNSICMDYINKIMMRENIDVWNNGQIWRDFVYVSDVIDVMLKIIASPQDKHIIYNVGYEDVVSIKSLIDALTNELKAQELIDDTKPILNMHNELPNTIPTILLSDCQQLRRDFDYKPKVNFAQGINKLISWYKEFTSVPF